MTTSLHFFKSPWFLWLAGGTISGIALIVPFGGIGTVVGVLLFLLAFDRSKSMRQTVLGSYLFGVTLMLGALSWVWEMYPLVLPGLEDGVGQFFILGLYLLSGALVIGSGKIVTGLGLWWFRKNGYRHRILAFLFVPIVWVLGELAGSFIFSIYTLGPGMTPNVNLSFGYIGYGIAQYPFLISIAVLGGVYALSLWTVLLAQVVHVLIRKKEQTNRAFTGVTLVLFFVLLGSNMSMTPADSVGMSILSIDTRVDGYLLLENDGYVTAREDVKRSVEHALTYAPDVVLIPEDSRLIRNFKSSDEALAFVTERSNGKDTLVFDSARTSYDDSTDVASRAYVYDTKAQKVHTIDKQYLVPQGEYIPYVHHVLLRLFASEALLTYLERRERYRPGPLVEQSGGTEHIPGIIFCFESINPTGVRSVLGDKNVPFVFHPISHSWFHDPNILWQEQDVMLSVQAVWNRIPIISAGNMVAGQMYTPDGKRVRGTVREEEPLWDIVEYTL